MNEPQARKLIDVYNKAIDHFKGDRDKARLWLFIPNPMIDHKAWSPFQMVQMGMANRLIKKMEENEKNNL